MRALHVPGVLDMVPTDDDLGTHEIDVGPAAGFAGGITDWKGSYAFVVLEDLSPDDLHRVIGNAARYFRRHGEAGYRDQDVATHPRVAELVSHARIAPLPQDLEAKGPYRIIEIAFQRNADDSFQCTVSREGKEIAGIGGPLSDIVASSGERARSIDRDRLVDRIVRALTHDLASSALVGLAFEIADSEHDLDAWEASLAALPNDRALAIEIAAVLASATEDVALLPMFGEARRTTMPSVRVRADLVLPEEQLWTVIAEKSAIAPPPAPSKRRERTPPLALAVLVLGAVLLVIAFVLSKR